MIHVDRNPKLKESQLAMDTTPTLYQ